MKKVFLLLVLVVAGATITHAKNTDLFNFFEDEVQVIKNHLRNGTDYVEAKAIMNNYGMTKIEHDTVYLYTLPVFSKQIHVQDTDGHKYLIALKESSNTLMTIPYERQDSPVIPGHSFNREIGVVEYYGPKHHLSETYTHIPANNHYGVRVYNHTRYDATGYSYREKISEENGDWIENYFSYGKLTKKVEFYGGFISTEEY